MIFRFFTFLLLSLPCHGFENFESRQVNPIDLTPDGSLLLALQSTTHRLSVFDVGNPARSTPLLIAEIPVSTSPVSVRARTNDEVWVVNEVSDSLSIVSLSRRLVIDTLRVADEPADVIFANGRAFVSCAQARKILVFDAVTRQPLGEIAIAALQPRALAVSPNGSTVYVASLDSGNQTTILPRSDAPLPPAPTNIDLPPAPPTALIVAADDPRISHTVVDHDIAAIDTNTLEIQQWFGGIGTHIFDIATHSDGSIFCANSESLNLVRFEPELRGHFSLHRLSALNPTNSAITHHDLNPGIDRATTPDPASIARALAQPTSITLDSDGSRAWITAFNSDRVAEIDTSTGEILKNIDLRPAGASSLAMRGPRAATMNADSSRLYVLNKISDTLVTIDPEAGDLLSDIPLGSSDPMPSNIREGRGVLYDARLSGNGTVSCATCHLDADRDGLAWDLGDPGGQMITIASAALSVHDFTVFDRQVHPMKGPLTTQTLRGLALNDAIPNDPTTGAPRPSAAITTKFHWRGDKPSIQSFNSTFPNLMGGTEVPDSHMDRLTEYLLSIPLHPNPNINPDRTLSDSALRGFTLFVDHIQSHCTVCHGPTAGTDQNLDDFLTIGKSQPMKNPGFRQLYTRADIFDPAGTSLSGFGLGSDGTGHNLPIVHPYALDLLDIPPLNANKLQNLADIKAFLLSFNTGTAPAVGRDLTLTPENRSEATITTDIDLLEAEAINERSGLAAWGQLAGQACQIRFDPTTSLYIRDHQADQPLTRIQVLELLANDDRLTFSGVPFSEIQIRSGDRNLNGLPDCAEPGPKPVLRVVDGQMQLHWTDGLDWFPQAAPNLTSPWLPAQGENSPSGFNIPGDRPAKQFFRLHRTW